MAKTTTKTEKVTAETTVTETPRRRKSFMDNMKDMHYDKRKGKTGWHYVVPSVLALFGMFGVLLYFLVTVISCFAPDTFAEQTLILVTNGFEKSLQVFGVGVGGYIGGAVANIFTKGGDVYTSQVTERETI